MGGGIYGKFGKTRGSQEIVLPVNDIILTSVSVTPLGGGSGHSVDEQIAFVKLNEDYKTLNKGTVGEVITFDENLSKVMFYNKNREPFTIEVVPSYLLKVISLTEFEAFFV
ncbi:hypothetical protein [Streptococcus fryi]